MSPRFKVGDIIVTETGNEWKILDIYYDIQNYEIELLKGSSLAWIGKEGTIKKYGYFEIDRHELIKSKKMSSLKEAIKLALKKEPEKSFIEVGIMDINEDLTPDGRDLVMKFFLDKNKEEFNKEVVQPILAEMKSKKQ